MGSIQSGSQKRERAEGLKFFFYAGPAEVVLYFILGLIALLILNARALADIVAGPSQNPSSSFGYIFVQYINDFLSRGRLNDILFWGFLGIITYLIFWLVRNVAINIHNDFASDKFEHPWPYSRSKYWRSIVRLKLSFILCLLFLASYIFLLSAFLPFVSHHFYLSLIAQEWLRQLPLIVGIVTVTAAAFYILGKILLALANLWRMITAGF